MFHQALDSLLMLVKEMPVQNAEDELSLIQFRLKQLEPYVVAQFQFDEQDLEADIKGYTGILQEYRENIGDKINFLIDIGKAGDSWDNYISLFLEEVLGDITNTSNRIVQSKF